MEQFRCSEDSFDAIYLCNGCSKMLCPNHYFSHQNEFPGHDIDHIAIPVINESRQILIKLVLDLKKKLISIIHNTDPDFWDIRKSVLAWNIEKFLSRLNLLYFSLTKMQYIPIKIFYTPFEYFLLNPAEKVLKFASEFNFPQRVLEFVNIPYIDNFFFFNYFNYFNHEEKKYIFGWTYKHTNFNLLLVCFDTLFDFLLNSEYEKAYEVLDNCKTLFEIVSEEMVSFCSSIFDIIYKYIKNRDISELIEKWKYLEKSLSKKYFLSFLFYQISEPLFQSLDLNELLYYCLKKKKIIINNQCPQFKPIYEAYLPTLYYLYGNFKLAIKFSKKVIKSPKNYDLKSWIWSWIIILNRRDTTSIKQMNIAKIIKMINKAVDSVENKQEIEEHLFYLNLVIWNFNDALKMGWRLLKLYKKNKINLYQTEAGIYFGMGWIYFIKNDLEYARRLFCNAKSCSGILGNDTLQAHISSYLGHIDIEKGCFKDALNHFEYANKFSNKWSAFQTNNMFIGTANARMQEYEKSLEYHLEVEKNIHSLPTGNAGVYSIFSNIGKLYKLTNNPEKANEYYNKAFSNIDAPDKYYVGVHQSIDDIFNYFLKKGDYEKCKAILQRKTESFRIWNFWGIIWLKSKLFIQWWKLCLAQNNKEEANKYRFEVEKILDIDKIWVLHKNPDNVNILQLFLILASIYVFKFKDFNKAEKICKAIEGGLDINLPINAWYFWKLFRFLCQLYVSQENWTEAEKYNKKLLDLLKTSHQNENFRYQIRLRAQEIEENITINEMLAEEIRKNLAMVD